MLTNWFLRKMTIRMMNNNLTYNDIIFLTFCKAWLQRYGKEWIRDEG